MIPCTYYVFSHSQKCCKIFKFSRLDETYSHCVCMCVRLWYSFWFQHGHQFLRYSLWLLRSPPIISIGSLSLCLVKLSITCPSWAATATAQSSMDKFMILHYCLSQIHDPDCAREWSERNLKLSNQTNLILPTIFYVILLMESFH